MFRVFLIAFFCIGCSDDGAGSSAPVMPGGEPASDDGGGESAGNAMDDSMAGEDDS